jgi:hypothetical protein
MTDSINEQLQDYYMGEVPNYVRNAGRTYITIKTEDRNSPLKITINDVIRYYREEAGSMSGCRSIAGLIGDWRNIDRLADECLGYFKMVNVDMLRREGKRVGMLAKF